MTDSNETPPSDSNDPPTSDSSETPSSDSTETPSSDSTETPAGDTAETPAGDTAETPAGDSTETSPSDTTAAPPTDGTGAAPTDRSRPSIEWVENYRAVKLRTEAIVGALLGLLALALVLRAASGYLPGIVVVPPVVIALTFVPGVLFLLALDYELGLDARSIVYALGCSLMLLMITGAAVNLVLPTVGYDTPLSALPLAVAVGLLAVALAGLALRGGSLHEVEVPVLSLVSPAPLALSLLPLTSVLAITVWNRMGVNGPLLLVLTVLAFVPLALVLAVDERWYAYGIWSMGLAGLYHTSLFKYNGFSGNPAGVWTYGRQRWTPGVEQVQETSSELLQNGVLFPLYAHLTDVQILAQYDVVNPFLVAFIPVALFVAFRSFVPARAALLAAAAFVVAHPFYIQYPFAGRAATPVLFLALLGVLISDSGPLAARARMLLGLLFGSGIVVSHYGTTYFVMFALFAALLMLFAYHLYDRNTLSSEVTALDWADQEHASARSLLRSDDTSSALVSWSYVGWYSVAAIAWYFYVAGGRKFGVLPNHTYRTIDQLLGGDVGSGRSTARVQRDYGSEVIDFSRRLYFLVALLMGIGLALAYYRRFVGDREPLVDDTYLAIATALLGFFGLTFVVRTWGGGRPMMIAFTFTPLFAVVGLAVIGSAGRSAVRRRGLPRLERFDAGRLDDRGLLTAFGCFLAVLLLLNTGVVSAAFGLGNAPSNVPVSDESTYNEDIALHAWMVQHHTGPNVVGDLTTNGQTDWYRPQIVERSDPPADYGGWQPRGRLSELSTETGDVEEPPSYGYILIMGHNTQEGVVHREPHQEPVPVESIEPGLDQHSQIYANGVSGIYYRPPNESR